MQKKLGFLLLFTLQVFYGFSSHLVGGEFEIIHLEGNTFLFRQIQYFDVLTGNPGAKDDSVQVSIFRKMDDVYVRNVTMHLIEEEKVQYSNPSCEDFRLSTRRQVYETEVILNPDDFDDPGGYYMVWERCCRNVSISNILNPDETGQTFYIEFPELVRNGERFINSTPQLFPPLSDYACVDQFYYADFRGYDADGDSLVYSMANPLNSTISSPQDPVPTPSPAPHSSVNWASGYDIDNQIKGSNPLKISTGGLLTVTPSQTGLFVFSVKVEEYRNGEKIGEVRRDFQLLVVDCPPPGNKPEIKVRQSGSSTYQDDLGTVNLSYGENTCFELIVNDVDGNENIRVKAVPVNFIDSLQDELSIDEGIILNSTDTFKFDFCFPRCILEGSFNPAIVDIFVYDDQCPQSLIDTLRITANVQQPPNTFPEITLPSSELENRSFLEGGSFSLPVKGIDADNDSLSLQVIPLGFNIEDYGITVDTLAMQNGEVEYQLNWSTDCARYPLGDKNEFDLMIVLEDYDECLRSSADTAYYHVKIELPPNNPPLLSVNGWEKDTTIGVRIEELANFLIKAVDEDIGDEVKITANPVSFNLDDFGLSFPDATGTGSVQQNFPWQLFCGDVDLNVRDTFSVMFVAEDFDRCKGKNADTVILTIKLEPPLNHPPVIIVNDEINSDTIYTVVGENILLSISASDPDHDNVNLLMIGADSLSDYLGVEVAIENKLSLSTGEFKWTLQCEHLNVGFKDSTYVFTLRANDDKCYVADTVERKIAVVVQDIFENYNFEPPNAFTPNTEDDINRYYYIPGLPLDNCSSEFQEIVIYNRWGEEVFRSASRDFRWSGSDNASGVYYYSLVYSHKTFKGVINLIK